MVLVDSVIDDGLLALRSYPPVRAALTIVTALAAAQAGIAVGRRAQKLPKRPTTPAVLSGLWLLLLGLGVISAARMSDERAAPLLSRPIAGRLLALARAVTDFDRDGSSQWFAGGDCAPFDRNVSPRAREIPDNGVDDNCRFGDARPRTFEAGDVPVANTPSPANVIVVTIDSLRADHMGCYGYTRRTTPRLDEFAKSARRFTHAYTSGGWTSLAVPSMLSGLYPRRLDWEAVAITSKPRIVPFPWEGALAPGETWLTNLSAPVGMPSATIPRWLRRRGMLTAAVLTSKPAAIFEYRGFLEENFEKVVALPDGDDAQAVDAALALIDSSADRPFFLWVHLYDPHEPYGPHSGIPTFGIGLEDVYDHDVAFTDRELGRLIAAIDQKRDRPTGLIVTADHGESFLGGLPVHGVELHEETIRIPLLVRGPSVTAGVSDAPASLVDVAPTTFEWTQTPPPPRLDGGGLVRPDRTRMPITDVWRHDRSGHVYIDMTGAAGSTRRLVIDRFSNAASVYAVGDISRPARALAERPDPRMTDLLGRYLEEAGTLER
jgi:arylsulfatase A-like enzyme